MKSYGNIKSKTGIYVTVFYMNITNIRHFVKFISKYLTDSHNYVSLELIYLYVVRHDGKYES